MKREALIRALHKRARKENVSFEVILGRGKGSHATIRYGSKQTTLKSGELSPAYVGLINRQLGLD